MASSFYLGVHGGMVSGDLKTELLQLLRRIVAKIQVLAHRDKNTYIIGFNQFLLQFENGIQVWFLNLKLRKQRKFGFARQVEKVLGY